MCMYSLPPKLEVVVRRFLVGAAAAYETSASERELSFGNSFPPKLEVAVRRFWGVRQLRKEENEHYPIKECEQKCSGSELWFELSCSQ